MDGGLILTEALPERGPAAGAGAAFSAMPPERPRAMPVQPISRKTAGRRKAPTTGIRVRWRRVLVLGGAALLGAGAIYQMSRVLEVGGMTPIEQEGLPLDRPLDEVLATLAWPDEVAGCALVVERIVLPPEAEATLPEGGDLARTVAAHPDRHDVRMAVAVLRDGSRACALRLRDHDSDDQVLTGPDLVPRLADALDATLRD